MPVNPLHRGLNAGQDGAHGQRGEGGSWEEEGGGGGGEKGTAGSGCPPLSIREEAGRGRIGKAGPLKCLLNILTYL